MDQPSSFEEQRQTTIRRNKQLLEQLDLTSITHDDNTGITPRATVKDSATPTAQLFQDPNSDDDGEPIRRVKRPKPAVNLRETDSRPANFDIGRHTRLQYEADSGVRRSKRLAEKGPIDFTEDYTEQRAFEALYVPHAAEDEEEEEEVELPGLKGLPYTQEEARALRDVSEIQITPDLKFKDLISTEEQDPTLPEIEELLKTYPESFSVGDYFDNVCAKEHGHNTGYSEVSELRTLFRNLKLYRGWTPKELRITDARAQFCKFHPVSNHCRDLIMASDTYGNLGIFNPANTSEKEMNTYRLHPRNITSFNHSENDLNKVYTASGDCTVGVFDLEELSVTDFYSNKDDKSGITDLKIRSTTMFFSRENGTFYKLDIREPNNEQSCQILRLHNEKITGFALNPKDENYLATSSLERQLKVWDLRFVKDCDWYFHEGSEAQYQTAGDLMRYDSRLSISYVDWNQSNQLVTSGFANELNLFNLKDISQVQYDSYHTSLLSPDVTKRHNCRTSVKLSTILKPRWQRNPKDQVEKFIVANLDRWLDVYDGKGNQVAHLGGPENNMVDVPGACAIHPETNSVIGVGSKGNLYYYC
ncbi:hypothetical protein WICPIJ_004703 [Wickerhamomyces pijperi]|uniref:DNA damage-binding protein CMR1 n=1 Tax=Wickerhamomyces pijperi TaxID=599730 RepID=A0A9P8Q576_WICPI|nr:hypothetical protein WICPIJ_004703 [Wickerhamomyces pijperi]